jgi:tetratricopeptide (TPR) repeat protein
MSGRWQQAEPFFDRALAQAPADPEIVYGYLDALNTRQTRKQLGEAEQKRRLAAEALRLLPFVKTRARAIEAIADALLDAGQPEEAWHIAKEALAQADAPSLVRLQLGKLAARSGLHQEEGLVHLDQALREPMEGGSAGYPGACWRKGQILKALGKKSEARAAAEASLKLDSKHPGAKKLLSVL